MYKTISKNNTPGVIKNRSNRPTQPKNNNRQQQQGGYNKKSASYAKIKKVTGLKKTKVTSISKRRMYRLSVIFGSTVLADTFTLDKPFGESVMDLRDKVLRSYSDLTTLISSDVKASLLPKVVFDIKKRVNNTDDLFKVKYKDPVDAIVNEAYKHEVINNVLSFPTIVNIKIKPGKKVKGVSSRVVVRLNLVTEPNFAPKKKRK